MAMYKITLRSPNVDPGNEPPYEGPQVFVDGDQVVEYDGSTDGIAAKDLPVGCKMRRGKGLPFLEVLSVENTEA